MGSYEYSVAGGPVNLTVHRAVLNRSGEAGSQLECPGAVGTPCASEQPSRQAFSQALRLERSLLHRDFTGAISRNAVSGDFAAAGQFYESATRPCGLWDPGAFGY